MLASIRDWCSSEPKDIQKQYKNVSNNLMDLLVGLANGSLFDQNQHKMTFLTNTRRVCHVQPMNAISRYQDDSLKVQTEC
jgi:hypothetical protein